METISNVEVFGLENSFKASKYPFALETNKCNGDMTGTIKKLAKCQTGTGHDTFLNGIVVQFDLMLTLKAWPQAERYNFFNFISSQSLMHCIEGFNIRKQCNEYVSEVIIEEVELLQLKYRENKTTENFLKLIYNIPSGFRYTARMTTNYRQLKTIYQQRKNHRLPEWKAICKWIETLPHSYLITGNGEENE